VREGERKWLSSLKEEEIIMVWGRNEKSTSLSASVGKTDRRVV
jgi:hypothetical protein